MPCGFSIKFALAVGLLLLLTLGVTAWVIIRDQNKDLYDSSSMRAKTVLSFGEACRVYARRHVISGRRSPDEHDGSSRPTRRVVVPRNR